MPTGTIAKIGVCVCALSAAGRHQLVLTSSCSGEFMNSSSSKYRMPKSPREHNIVRVHKGVSTCPSRFRLIP